MYLGRAGTYAVRGLSTSITVLLVIAGERRERRKRNTERQRDYRKRKKWQEKQENRRGK
jgi:hypothetical protein